MNKELGPNQLNVLVSNPAVNEEFSQKIRELDRRLQANGMSYRDWDTLNDRQHEIFSHDMFLDGECATSPEHYVKGAVESCGCPDTVEDLHHHSPVLMREIEKQQEMLPDMKVKIGESLSFLNEMIDEELSALLEQPDSQRFPRPVASKGGGTEFARGVPRPAGPKFTQPKEETPAQKARRETRELNKAKKAADDALAARLTTLEKMAKAAASDKNKGDKYELNVLKLLLGDDPFHTLLSARDVVAGSTAAADAAIAIDGEPYNVELKLGANDQMGSGNVKGVFELTPKGDESGKQSWKPSEGLPNRAFADFLLTYSKTQLPDDMKKVRDALRNFDYPASAEDTRLVQNTQENFPDQDPRLIDDKFYFRKKSGMPFNGPKLKDGEVKPGKAILLADQDYKKSALQKFQKAGTATYPGFATTAAWNAAGSQVEFATDIRRLGDRFGSDPIKTASDFIEERYLKKNVHYIQIGPTKSGKDPKGLYLLGDEDPAGIKKYGLPNFEIGPEVDMELRLGTFGSGPSYDNAITLINGMTNLSDPERDYLLAQPVGFYVSYMLRASARIAEKGAALKQSPMTLDTKEGVMELVGKLCDDGRTTGVPALTPEGKTVNAEAISYCALKKSGFPEQIDYLARKALDKQKPSPVALGPAGDGSNQLPGPFNRDEE